MWSRSARAAPGGQHHFAAAPAAAARSAAACDQQPGAGDRHGARHPDGTGIGTGHHRPRTRAQHAHACPAAQHDHACARTVHDEPGARAEHNQPGTPAEYDRPGAAPDREHACAGHARPRICAHARPVMAPRPGATDWWARGRAQGVRDAARALDSTAWYRVPMPLPADPAGRARFLAGYAAGIEDGLEVSRAA